MKLDACNSRGIGISSLSENHWIRSAFSYVAKQVVKGEVPVSNCLMTCLKLKLSEMNSVTGTAR